MSYVTYKRITAKNIFYKFVTFETLKAQKKISNKLSKRKLNTTISGYEKNKLYKIFDYSVGDKIYSDLFGMLTISNIRPVINKIVNSSGKSKKRWYVGDFILSFKELDLIDSKLKLSWIDEFSIIKLENKSISIADIKENLITYVKCNLCGINMRHLNSKNTITNVSKFVYYVLTTNDSDVFEEDFSYKEEFLNKLKDLDSKIIFPWFFPTKDDKSCFCETCWSFS